MNDRDVRGAVVSSGSWLASRGLAPGASGNISVRSTDGLILTPTGTALGRLDAGRLSLVDTAGAHLLGDAPTKEYPLHLAVYEARPTANAIVHLHSTHAVAVSCLDDINAEEPIAPITPYQVMRIYPVVLVPYARPGSQALAESVGRGALAADALLLQNHGLVVAASSLDEAVYKAEEFEEAAKLSLVLAGRAVRRLRREEIDQISLALDR